MSDREELAFAVECRRSGEPLTYWAEHDRELTILFDRRPLKRWSAYKISEEFIPGAYLVLNASSIEGMTGGAIAGIYIWGGVDTLLSFYYALRWKANYLPMALKYNKAREEEEVSVIWNLYAAFLLRQCEVDDPEAAELGYQKYSAYGDIIDGKLKDFGSTVHIPLLVDNPDLGYMAN